MGLTGFNRARREAAQRSEQESKPAPEPTQAPEPAKTASRKTRKSAQ